MSAELISAGWYRCNLCGCEGTRNEIFKHNDYPAWRIYWQPNRRKYNVKENGLVVYQKRQDIKPILDAIKKEAALYSE